MAADIYAQSENFLLRCEIRWEEEVLAYIVVSYRIVAVILEHSFSSFTVSLVLGAITHGTVVLSKSH